MFFFFLCFPKSFFLISWCCIDLSTVPQVPRDEEGEPLYEDFICKACSISFTFLGPYPQSIWASGWQYDATVETNKDKNVLEDNCSAGGSGKVDDVDAHDNPIADNANTSSEPLSDGDGLSLGVTFQENAGSNQSVKDSSSHTTCLLEVNLDAPFVFDSKPLFLSKNWRNALCRCEKCLVLYNQKHISFLLDKEDSIAEYEKMATQKRKEKLQQQEGAELSLLDKFGHVEKMEILNGIADMKNEIHSFLVSLWSYDFLVTYVLLLASRIGQGKAWKLAFSLSHFTFTILCLHVQTFFFSISGVV